MPAHYLTFTHYPSYAYSHPLFTEGMKIYSDSKVSDFLQSMDSGGWLK